MHFVRYCGYNFLWVHMDYNLIKKRKKVVGFKQVLRAIQLDTAEIVILTEDADVFYKARVQQACEENPPVQILPFESMKELGKLCEIAVPAAVVAILKN